MERVVTAPRAVLLELHAIGSSSLVLGHSIVAALAFGASEGNHSTH